MTIVRMLRDMTGGRHDGRSWPGYKGLIDVPEWEAKDLVTGANAEYPDAPDLDRGYDVLRVAHPNFESGLRRLDGSVPSEAEEEEEAVVLDYDSDFDRDDSDNDFGCEELVTVPVKRPVTTDNKAAWIEYARSKGDMEADSKTKAKLIEEYGQS
jgi:hypothetical protein